MMTTRNTAESISLGTTRETFLLSKPCSWHFGYMKEKSMLCPKMTFTTPYFIRRFGRYMAS